MTSNVSVKVSVIVPAFNRVAMLERAVDSILAQELTGFELIVVDDCSSENLQVVRGKVEAFGGKFIRTTKNLGPAAARNLGAQKAKGAWLSFLDSDDLWRSDKLAKQVAYHEDNKDCLISQCKELWYRDGKFVNPRFRHQMPVGDFFLPSLELCLVSPSSVFIEKQFFASNGGFDERLRLCEDYDLWLRLSLQSPIGLLEENLVEKFGGHEDQLSRSEHALDRYRVFALAKLMNDSRLSSAKKEALLEVLKAKLSILLEGAKKRNQVGDLDLYERLLREAEVGELSGQLESDYAGFLENSERFKKPAF